MRKERQSRPTGRTYTAEGRAAYYNGHLYVPRSDPKGIRVYDLRDDRFDIVGTLPSHAFGRMAICDGWLICMNNHTLETYDLRQGPLPQQSVVLSAIQQPASYDFEDNRFVLAVKDEFMVYEITDWPQLKLLTKVREHKKVVPPQGPVLLAGDSLWWGGSNQRPLRYDLSDLTNITAEDAACSLPGRAFFRQGDRVAFFANRASQLFEIDRTANTIRKGKQLIFNPPNSGATFPVGMTSIVNDDVLIYSGHNGVSAYALNGETGPQLLGSASGPSLRSTDGVATRDGVLYCNGNIFDFQDPRDPHFHTDVFLRGPAIAIIKNRLVVADRDALLVYSLEDPLKPQEIQREPVPDDVQAMATHGDSLWVASDSGIIRRYQARAQLKKSAELWAARGTRGFSSLAVDKEHLIAAVVAPVRDRPAAIKGKEIIGYRLRPDGQVLPRRRFSFPDPNHTLQLHLRDGLVIMTNTVGGLRIVDLFQDQPTQLAGLEPVETSLSLALHGNTGYVAEGFSGVSIVGFDWDAIGRAAEARRGAAEKVKPFAEWIEKLEARRITRGEGGQVEKLDLSGLEITEEIMTKLALAPVLHTLKMQKCRLAASVFASFAELKNLRDLNLHEAKIAGADLGVLASLPNLTNLTLRGTDVSDSQLKGLAGAPRLAKLSLGHTQLSDAGLAVLTQLPALDHLGLHVSRITSAGLEALLPLADQLLLLRLSHTAVDDDAAAIIGQLSSLTFLELMHTEVGDAGLLHLARLPALESLILRGSPVTSAGVKAIPPIPSLQRLVVGQLDAPAVEHLLAQPSLRYLSALDTKVDQALAEKISASRLTELTVRRGDISPAAIQILQAEKIKVGLMENGLASQPTAQDDVAGIRGQPLFTGSDGDLEWAAFAGGVVSIGYRGEYETTDLEKTFQQDELAIATALAVGRALWVGSNRGIFEYDPQTRSWTRMAINASEVTADVHNLALAGSIVSVSYGVDATASFDISARRWLTTTLPAPEPTPVSPPANIGSDKAPILWLLIAGLIVATLGIGLRMRTKDQT